MKHYTQKEIVEKFFHLFCSQKTDDIVFEDLTKSSCHSEDAKGIFLYNLHGLFLCWADLLVKSDRHQSIQELCHRVILDGNEALCRYRELKYYMSNLFSSVSSKDISEDDKKAFCSILAGMIEFYTDVNQALKREAFECENKQ